MRVTGAVPATIGVLEGTIRVGLAEDELDDTGNGVWGNAHLVDASSSVVHADGGGTVVLYGLSGVLGGVLGGWVSTQWGLAAVFWCATGAAELAACAAWAVGLAQRRAVRPTSAAA